jgi:hypothetical protein
MRIPLLLLPLCVLSGCVQKDSGTLEQSLAGKSPQERQTILRRDCLNESEHLGKTSLTPRRTNHGALLNEDSDETDDLKDVCFDLLHANMENMLDGKTPDERKMILAKECGSEIAKNDVHSDHHIHGHADTMRLICKEFTGMTIPGH